MTGDAMSESKHHDDLRARIADVLRLHQWRATVRTSDDDPVLDCSCGVAFGGALDCQRGAFDSHREHVADAVIRELGLRPEKGQRSNATGPLWGSNNRHTVTRYVTEWESDDKV